MDKEKKIVQTQSKLCGKRKEANTNVNKIKTQTYNVTCIILSGCARAACA